MDHLTVRDELLQETDVIKNPNERVIAICRLVIRMRDEWPEGEIDALKRGCFHACLEVIGNGHR